MGVGELLCYSMYLRAPQADRKWLARLLKPLAILVEEDSCTRTHALISNQINHCNEREMLGKRIMNKMHIQQEYKSQVKKSFQQQGWRGHHKWGGHDVKYTGEFKVERKMVRISISVIFIGTRKENKYTTNKKKNLGLFHFNMHVFSVEFLF